MTIKHVHSLSNQMNYDCTKWSGYNGYLEEELTRGLIGLSVVIGQLLFCLITHPRIQAEHMINNGLCLRRIDMAMGCTCTEEMYMYGMGKPSQDQSIGQGNGHYCNNCG